VIPSLDLVISWNDTTLGSKAGNPGEAIKRVVAAVLPDTPRITLSTSAINRTTDHGSDPDDDVFTVANSGGGTLVYTISTAQPWLSVTPSAGTSTGEADAITVSYTTHSLPIGPHTATIEVRDNGSSPPASNSPQSITVTVDVRSVLPDLDLDTDVDQEDFGRFQACLSGQDTPSPSCLGADFNHDELVNQVDFTVFLGCMSGPEVPAM